MSRSKLLLMTCTAMFISAGCSNPMSPNASQKAVTADKPAPIAAAAEEGFPAHVYWGDTHLHTSYSFDVFLFGTPASTPEGAFRFAKGERVENPTTGEAWQLNRPLDFLVVSDHAELMGNVARVFRGVGELDETPTGRALIAEGGTGAGDDLLKAYHYLVNTATGAVEDAKHGLTPKQIFDDLHGGDKRFDVWSAITNEADKHNDPGNFTAMIGWEWSSHPKGANLHRIVLTSADAKTSQNFLPFSQMESDRPEDLWAWLEATRDRTGADFVAIPHNPNVSMGRMFMLEDSDGNEITADYAKRRLMWEPIVEMTQIKGDSETHPRLSPTDEFADFETWNFVMLPSGPTPEPVEAEYIRSALKRGLKIENTTGVNPYKFGMIGSTDSHTGLSTSGERNFAGKGQKDSRPELRGDKTGLGSSKGWDMGAAGLVAAWAPENNRDEIFAAFRRKEVYATTGTRIRLRFFAGADISGDSAAPISRATYESAVPMGGDLRRLDTSPEFLIQAMKDPEGANLDRVQMIKGWIDENGETHEKIFDVAWSGERNPSPDGKLPPVGNTVNLNTGDYSNSIGDTTFSVIWHDPEFEPEQNAFYYVRVLEIPTPRYSLLNAIELGIDWNDTGRPATIQERAYSSPIWYTP